MQNYIRPFSKSVMSRIDLSIGSKLMVCHTEAMCKVSSKSEKVESDDLLSISGIAQKWRDNVFEGECAEQTFRLACGIFWRKLYPTMLTKFDCVVQVDETYVKADVKKLPG